MADRAVAVADDLHLDVTRFPDQPFDIDGIVAERRLGLRLAARIGLLEFCGVLDHAHTAPAAAGDRLDHHGGVRAERGEEGFCLVERGRARGAGDNRHAAFSREVLGLVAEQVERLRRRADENDLLLGATPCQLRILAEEAIARMQRIAARSPGRRDHRLDVQIGARAAAGDLAGIVGGADMQRGRIVGGIDGDRGKAALGRGTGDADGDLTAVGNQQFLEGHDRFQPCASV